MDFEAELAAFAAEIDAIPAKETKKKAKKKATPSNQVYAPGEVHLYNESPAESNVPTGVSYSSAPVIHKKKKRKKLTDSNGETSKKKTKSSSTEKNPWEQDMPIAPPVVIPGDLAAVQAAQKQKEIKANNLKSAKEKKKDPYKYFRTAAGETWEDTSMSQWPENDFRIFCGDLGNEVNDNTLGKIFQGYASFNRARVVRDKRTQKTKGFGFVSFGDPYDCANALRECNGKYCGNRPIKLRRSNWRNRQIRNVPGARAKVRKKSRKRRHLF